MTSEVAETTTIQEALDMYVRSLKDGKSKAKSQSKSGVADKPVDLNALQGFMRWFADRATSLSELSPQDIRAYAEKINGDGTTPQAAEQLQAVKNFLAYAHKSANLTDKNLASAVYIRKPRNRKGAVISNEPQPIELTSEGRTQLEDERDKLTTEIQVLAREIHRARADGDVTENSPLDAAREEQAHKEARVQVIKATLEKAVIIDQTQTGEAAIVKIGAQVMVEENGKQTSYTLVNSAEAKPLDRRISDESPMGEALRDKTVGDEVEVKTPGGVKRYKIISIS